MSIVDNKVTSLPDFRLENIGLKNPSRVRRQRTKETRLILVPLVEDEEIEEIVQELILQLLTMRDLKIGSN
jgi:hypothetical protein